MRAVHSELPTRLQLRTCLRCGYCGPELQGDKGDRTFTCPACGEDLYARPAKSYAELEGLDEPGWMGHWGLTTRLEHGLAGFFGRILGWLGRAVFQRR